MSTYRLTVNDARFYLPPGEDVARIKSALLDAVNGGGGFIELYNAARVKVDLLVTSHCHIQIEEFREVDDIDADELWQRPPASTAEGFDDLDFDFDYAYDLGAARLRHTSAA